MRSVGFALYILEVEAEHPVLVRRVVEFDVEALNMRFTKVGHDCLPGLATESGHGETVIFQTRVGVDTDLARRIDNLQLVVLPLHVVSRHVEAALAVSKVRLVTQLIVFQEIRIVSIREERLAATPVDAALAHTFGVQAVDHLVVAEPVAQTDFGDELRFGSLAPGRLAAIRQTVLPVLTGQHVRLADGQTAAARIVTTRMVNEVVLRVGAIEVTATQG